MNEPTRKLSPASMMELQRAAGSGVTREMRGWQPPSVEDLQRMLPQYEITAFLARGGMGAVYKGVQRSLDRTVAIKILPPDLVDDGEANYAQRFKQEARAMAKFKHPGIVTVYEAGEVTLQGQGGVGQEGQGGTLLYFVMEFVEGTDVAQLVAAHGRLTPEHALSITTHVCEALAYAHKRDVVHRDIKPSNIMIEADGTVKVADFGLAKMAAAQDSAGLTKSNVAMGTPDFLAPEALIPGMQLDQRADLYAVGVMLYQMLTGHIPRGRFSPISAVVPKSDPKLDAIVDKAMQTDREKRYSTAVEMKADVERVFQLVPKERAGRTSWKTRSMLLTAAAVIVLGAGGWMMWKGSPLPTAGKEPTLKATASASIVPTSIPRPTRLTWKGPRLSPEMETAKTQGGSLRLWGSFKGGIPLPTEHKEFSSTDFVRVAGDYDVLFALTKSQRGVGIRLVDGKPKVFAKGGVDALLRGRRTAMVGTGRTALSFDESPAHAFVSRPSALLAMKHTGGIFSMSAKGEVEWGTHRGVPSDTPPPSESIPKNLVAAVGNAHGIAFLEETGHVFYWDARRGQEVTRLNELSEIVEIDGGESHFISLRADGRVVVWGADASTKPPADLPPAVAVRASVYGCAAQMADGTWTAWGPDAAVNEKVSSIGPAINLELEHCRPGSKAKDAGYVAWIEPLARTSTSQPVASSDTPWHLPDGPPGFVKELVGHTGSVGGLAVLPDSRHLLSLCNISVNGRTHGELILWDTASGTAVWQREMSDEEGAVDAPIVILPKLDQAVVFRRERECALDFLSLKSGSTLNLVPNLLLEKPASPRSKMEASPDGSKLAVAVFSLQTGNHHPVYLKVYDMADRHLIGEWQAGAQAKSVYDMSWLDDDRIFMCFNDADKTKRVRQVVVNTSRQGSLPQPVKWEANIDHYFAVVPGTDSQIVIHGEGKLRLFDVDAQVKKKSWEIPGAATQKSILFLNSRHFLGLTETGPPRTLRLWHLDTDAVEWELTDERLSAAIALSPDRRFAATNQLDGAADPVKPNRSRKIAIWRLPKME